MKMFIFCLLLMILIIIAVFFLVLWTNANPPHQVWIRVEHKKSHTLALVDKAEWEQGRILKFSIDPKSWPMVPLTLSLDAKEWCEVGKCQK